MSQNITLRSLKLDGFGLQETAARMVASIAQAGGTKLVIPVNGQVFVTALRDPELADIINRADFVVPDGASITVGRRILGEPAVSRVPGVDLLGCLCAEADKESFRVFFLGGRPGAAERTIQVLGQQYPSLEFAAYCPPMGFDKRLDEIAKIKEEIRRFSPHLMFVAFGAPKQERFMDIHLRETGVPLIMAVGGSLELIGGMVTRAPRWVRTIGLEWTFRTVMEPRRLFMRYLVTNSVFCWNLLLERLRGPSRVAKQSCF